MDDFKLLAIICHLLGMFPIIGPVVTFAIWHSKKEESCLIRTQGRNALNFQLTLLVIGLVIGIIPLFSKLSTAIWLFRVIFAVIAASKVYNHKVYQYPFSYKFFKW